MPLITWNDSFKVNIARIDAQHQQLVIMINELNDAMRAGKGKAVLAEVINRMVAYAGSHFATEEIYFKQHAYPATAAHLAEHAAFVKTVSEFKKGFDEGRLAMSVEVMDFLSDWLRDHINGSDQKYVPFLKLRGVA